MPYSIGYTGSATNRFPTSDIWGQFTDNTHQGPRLNSESWVAFEDFKNVGISAGCLAGRGMVFTSFADSGDAFSCIAGDTAADVADYGVLNLLHAGTDNNELSLSGGGGAMKLTHGSNSLLAYEMRLVFRHASIATAQNVFLGLAAGGKAANDGMFADTATAITAVNAVGMRIVEGDPDGMDAVYNETSGTEQVVLNEAKVVVKDTWYKFGVLIDTRQNKVDYYVDGVIVSTLTGIASLSTFPSGAVLVPQFTSKNGAATARDIDVDWIAAGYKAP